jgi:hypothetical protein
MSSPVLDDSAPTGYGVNPVRGPSGIIPAALVGGPVSVEDVPLSNPEVELAVFSGARPLGGCGSGHDEDEGTKGEENQGKAPHGGSRLRR